LTADEMLAREIEVTGLEVRESLRAMADAFISAVNQIEQAARAWEEAAPLR
jgi:hypothetical protein